MLAKNYLSLFFLFALFHYSWQASSTILTKVRDRYREKSVIAVGDHMYTTMYHNLEELEDYVRQNKRLSKEELNRRLLVLPKKYSIEPMEDGGTRKIQLIQSANGREQYAISFVGMTSVGDKFAMADKSGINSISNLGNQLDEIYRVELTQRFRMNQRTKLKPHTFLVTNGKDVFSIEVGHGWGNLDPSFLSEGKLTPPKQPKITKEKGKLFVQGWASGNEMYEDLAPTFGGQKRAKIEMKEAKEKLTAAFKKQSRLYRSPNFVSESFAGYNVHREPGRFDRIEHLNRNEMEWLKSRQPTSEQEIVNHFYKEGWINDAKRWRNPILDRMAQNAREQFGQEAIPFVDEEVPSFSGSLSSGSGRIRPEISQPGPSSTMHSASGGTSISGRGRIRPEINQPGPSSTMHSASGGKSMSGRGKHQSVPSTPSNGHEHEQSMEMKRRKHEKRKGLFGRRKGIFGRNGGFARRFG